MTEHRMDILGELPLEIAQIVLMYLSPEDLVNSYSVSKRWCQLVSHDLVWSRHMPYQKYVEKYWKDAVGKSYDEGEGCRLMKRFLTESRIKNNKKQGKYNVITSVPYDSTSSIRIDRQVWSTKSGLLLSNGDLLKFKDTPDIELSESYMTLSSDLRLLAVPCKNFLYIYERKLPTVEFELLSLLAACPATGEEPDGSAMLSVVSCPKLDKESVASFMGKYESQDTLECAFFTGVDSSTERRVCLEVYHKHYYGLWDLDGKRLVHTWKRKSKCKVIEGWDRRGVCLTDDSYDGGLCNNWIKYYDVNMQLLTVIPLEEYFVDELIVSYNFSVAVIQSSDCEKRSIVMWEKESTEYRILFYGLWWYAVSVSPSTVAYQSDVNTVAIIAAPDWEVVARVGIVSIDNFHLTEFSDGSLFFVLRANNEYIWQDIDRRNTTEIFEWPIDCGHKFKLPEHTCVVNNNVAKLAIITGTKSDHVLSIIDYNK